MWHQLHCCSRAATSAEEISGIFAFRFYICCYYYCYYYYYYYCFETVIQDSLLSTTTHRQLRTGGYCFCTLFHTVLLGRISCTQCLDVAFCCMLTCKHTRSRDSYISRLLSLSLCLVTEALSDSFEFIGAIEISLSIYLSTVQRCGLLLHVDLRVCCMFLCWTQLWAVQKRLNRSRFGFCWPFLLHIGYMICCLAIPVQKPPLGHLEVIRTPRASFVSDL